MKAVIALLSMLMVLSGCATTKAERPTASEAEAFIDQTETDLLQLWIDRERMWWIQSTHITHDTNLMAAKAEEAVMAFMARVVPQATRFDAVRVSSDLRRKLNLLKRAPILPAPADAEKRGELARLSTTMASLYGQAKYCPERLDGKCLNLGDMTAILAESRDAEELLDIWKGWREQSLPMREMYERYVELGNEGARELGFSDMGALWRSKYDMDPDEFAADTERLWEQLKPLYVDLHCYVRSRLQDEYGPKLIPAKGPIPAHLLGNMWAQNWSNVFDLVAPEKTESLDVDAILVEAGIDSREMVRYGERFFSSLGLEVLPESFWERSQFDKPKDREVVCHASAWDIDWQDDLRIKMCINPTEEDFITIHHELGHNYYQRAYKHQSTLFADSANDGFHEALGDIIALSVTDPYLKKVGLIDKLPPPSLNGLMRRALEKIAFLPFGLMIDRWRWEVFSGAVPPEKYNDAWWEMRERYQGVRAPVSRRADHFDPGAKFHVSGGVPYTRYFLAHILQFQFHRALCELIGHEGPLHTCSIYGHEEAGEKLHAMMAMGLSRPWPDALEALSGEREMDASAIVEYFAPLHTWLKKENEGRVCGW